MRRGRLPLPLAGRGYVHLRHFGLAGAEQPLAQARRPAVGRHGPKLERVRHGLIHLVREQRPFSVEPQPTHGTALGAGATPDTDEVAVGALVGRRGDGPQTHGALESGEDPGQALGEAPQGRGHWPAAEGLLGAVVILLLVRVFRAPAVVPHQDFDAVSPRADEAAGVRDGPAQEVVAVDLEHAVALAQACALGDRSLGHVAHPRVRVPAGPREVEAVPVRVVVHYA